MAVTGFVRSRSAPQRTMISMRPVAFNTNKLRAEQTEYDESYGVQGEYKLKPAIERTLTEAIEGAPHFDYFAAVGQRLIRIIHGTPSLYLHAHVTRGHLEFYVGRTGARARNLFRRFESHATDAKYHHNGIVICRCDTAVAPRWEGIANKVVRQLKERHRLCVANLAAHGGGGIPKTAESVIYMTWKVLYQPVFLTQPVRADVDSVAKEVSAQVDGTTSEDTIRRAIDPITRLVVEAEDIEWAAGHAPPLAAPRAIR